MNSGILLSRKGIKLATKVLKTAIYLVRLSALCALKQPMLGKVGYTILATLLITATCPNDKGATSDTTTYIAVYSLDAIGESIGVKIFF